MPAGGAVQIAADPQPSQTVAAALAVLEPQQPGRESAARRRRALRRSSTRGVCATTAGAGGAGSAEHQNEDGERGAKRRGRDQANSYHVKRGPDGARAKRGTVTHPSSSAFFG